LRGQNIGEAKLNEMGEIIATEAVPMDDNRGSAEYKREMVKVLVQRAAKEALQRASDSPPLLS
jgi:CO/xanthine dehydrogenase FAD-binding subunit